MIEEDLKILFDNYKFYITIEGTISPSYCLELLLDGNVVKLMERYYMTGYRNPCKTPLYQALDMDKDNFNKTRVIYDLYKDQIENNEKIKLWCKNNNRKRVINKILKK